MITGTTRVFGILADPIGHVRTPEVMNAFLESQGVDGVLVPMQVAPEGLQELLSGLRRLRNLGGLVVTVPHKSAVLPLCDEVGEQARLVGAANAIRREPDGRLKCEMFDGKGFLSGLLGQGIDPKGSSVLLLGAGGAASAIAFALAEHGVSRLTVANRTGGKARDLAERVRASFPSCDSQAGPADPGGHDLVVNATSLGLRPEDPLPLDAERLDARTLVAEIVMKPERTALIQAAEGHGCRVHLGRHMLDSQIRLLAEFIGATAAVPEAVLTAAASPAS